MIAGSVRTILAICFWSILIFNHLPNRAKWCKPFMKLRKTSGKVGPLSEAKRILKLGFSLKKLLNLFLTFLVIDVLFDYERFCWYTIFFDILNQLTKHSYKNCK